MGVVVGLVMRLLSGDRVLGFKPVIHFPGCTLEDGVYFQYASIKTICMLFALMSIMVFSYLTSVLFNKQLFHDKFDVLKIRELHGPPPMTPVGSPTEWNRCLNKATQSGFTTSFGLSFSSRFFTPFSVIHPICMIINLNMMNFGLHVFKGQSSAAPTVQTSNGSLHMPLLI